MAATEVEKQANQSAPGATLMGEIYKGVTYRSGESNEWKVTLETGKCYWFSAVGDDKVQRISLYLWNPNGGREETERSRNPRTVLYHCPDEQGLHRFEAKTTRGNGHFAVGIYEGERPEPTAQPAPEPEPAAPTVDLEAMVTAEAKSAAPGAERVGDFYKDKADKRDWFVSLEAGYCYWLVGVGDPNTIDELTLYLWDSNKDRVGETKSQSNKVSMGHCPQSSDMYRFQAAIGSGDGNYAVGLFRKKK